MAVIGLKFATVFLLGEHEHLEKNPEYEYMAIEHKPFPFKDGQTGLFDSAKSHH